MTALVLWHRHFDGSGSSVHRVYIGQDDRANADLALLNAHHVEWHLHEVEMVTQSGEFIPSKRDPRL